jgi:hypothetical protein
MVGDHMGILGAVVFEPPSFFFCPSPPQVRQSDPTDQRLAALGREGCGVRAAARQNFCFVRGHDPPPSPPSRSECVWRAQCVSPCGTGIALRGKRFARNVCRESRVGAVPPVRAASNKSVFIDQGRRLGARKRSDTAHVSGSVRLLAFARSPRVSGEDPAARPPTEGPSGWSPRPPAGWQRTAQRPRCSSKRNAGDYAALSKLTSGLRSERSNPPRSVLAGPNDKFVQRRTRNAAAPVPRPKTPAKGRVDVGGFGKRREDRVALRRPTAVGAILECTLRCFSTPCREATRFRLLLGCSFVLNFSRPSLHCDRDRDRGVGKRLQAARHLCLACRTV